MLKRKDLLGLISIPLISIFGTWVFCLQENLQQLAQANASLEECLDALQEKLDRLERNAENEALPRFESESEQDQESMPFRGDRTMAGDPLRTPVHIVKAGETLHAIGMKYGISWTALMKHNSLERPNAINAGQEVRIPFGRTRIQTPGSVH